MLKKEIVIQNQTGLHARPATAFVKFANGFQSRLLILYKDKEIDAKSIVSLLTGGIGSGASFILQAEGSDEEEAITKAAEFLESLQD